MKMQFDEADKAIAAEVVNHLKARAAPAIEAARPFVEALTLLGLGSVRLSRAAKAALR